MKAIIYAVATAVLASKALTMSVYPQGADFVNAAITGTAFVVACHTVFGLIFFLLAVENDDYETIEKFEGIAFVPHVAAALVAMAVGMTVVGWVLAVVASIRVGIYLKSADEVAQFWS